MGVESRHGDYLARAPQWQKMRDVAEGQDVIHSRGQTYLPKLSGMEQGEYQAYVQRSLFYNATARTIEGLAGMVFAKPPKFDLPPAMAALKSDITRGGDSLLSFAQMLVVENLTVTRGGILVDFPPKSDGEVASVAEAERANLRPFLSYYRAENIIHWRSDRVNNITVLVEVRLLEELSEPGAAEFESHRVQQIRVLDRWQGMYRQRVYRQNDKGAWVRFGPEISPKMRGRMIGFLPFVFIGARNTTADCDKPVLLDLANTNLNHYRFDADLAHGAHFSGLPTPVITGLSGEGAGEFRIGGNAAWLLENENARAFYLETQGELKALEAIIERREQQMVTLGARMLAPDKRAVEAAETAAIHRRGENSVLASLALSISEALERSLGWARDWMGAQGEIAVELNRDYLDKRLTAPEIIALLQAWGDNAISYSDLIENFRKGGVVAEHRQPEAVAADIARGTETRS